MPLSPQQQAVIEWEATGKGSLKLVARAGCGKTFTLRKLVKAIIERVGSAVEIFFGAYNKSIADEIKGALAEDGVSWKNCDASTMHAAGFKAWRSANSGRRIKVEQYKVRNIIEAIMLDCRERALRATKAGDASLAAKLTAKADTCDNSGRFVEKLVSLAKNAALGVNKSYEDHHEWYALVDHFGLEDEMTDDFDIEQAVRLCVCVYKRSLDQCREIVDFDDMLLAPLYFGARFWPKDYVLIDEAQDTNEARRLLALAMLKPGTGRLVAVGDPRQAIYGFTGADSDSMDRLQAATNAVELPLTFTYRCPKAIVAEANLIVPDIEAHEDNEEGLVRSLPLHAETRERTTSELCDPAIGDTRPVKIEPDFFDEQLGSDAVVLCRNTKPLVEVAYALLREGRACYVEGRDIGQGLVALARRWKRIKNLQPLADRVVEYKEKEIAKALAKGKETRADQIEDKCDTLLVLIEACIAVGKDTVAELVASINEMFGDTKPGERPDCLTLSTVHKSKGREWPTVYILDRENLMPSKYARKEWQLEQESNLVYVAITRAQRELVYVTRSAA